MKTKYYFLTVVFINLFIVLVSTIFFDLDEMIFNNLSEQLAQEQIEKIIESQQKWQWVGYAVIPIVVLIRSSLVALCLSVGTFFYNMDHSYKFKQFFRIALIGEFVLVLVGFFKLAYFYFIKTEYTLQDIQQYYPLSYIIFFDIEKLQPWLVYPLQTINLFEITYFFVLVYGLWKLMKNKYLKSLEIVAISYGSGLLIWIGLIMFVTLNFT